MMDKLKEFLHHEAHKHERTFNSHVALGIEDQEYLKGFNEAKEEI
jgi:hypothetical protein